MWDYARFTEDERLRNRVTPKIYYKYFFIKPKKLEFNKVNFPIINRVFS
jgi:hypothetical protein